MQIIVKTTFLSALATTLAACTGDPASQVTTTTSTATDTWPGTSTTTGSTGGATDSGSAGSDSASSTTTTTGPVTATGSTGGTTGPGPCGNGEEDGEETDVDCGGSECDKCGLGKGCLVDTDCETDNCAVDKVCRPPECDDGLQNGDETAVDCGGPICSPCADGLGCAMASDCESGVCENDTCSVPTCMDGVQNQDETDADCGGATCDGCADGLMCSEHEDCAALLCVSGMCETINCTVDDDCDAVDEDCVYGVCNPNTMTCTPQDIANSQPCNLADPCMTGSCYNGTCNSIVPKDCSGLNGPCATGVCDAVMGCIAQPMADNMPCDDGSVCTQNSTCLAGVCQPGTATDCTYLDTACQVGSCNAGTGVCEAQAMADATPCDDGFACSTNDECFAGVCLGGGLTPMWDEDFEGNPMGWTLGTEWQLGPATASNCTIYGSDDPGTDHTAGNGNGIAGVKIGGCAATAQHADYCLESPTVDTSGANGPVILEFFRWLNSDYLPFMNNTVQVYDGNAWLQLWESGAYPGTTDAAWTETKFDVGAVKNANFKIRWCFTIESGGVFTVSSWNLDDVALLTCN